MNRSWFPKWARILQSRFSACQQLRVKSSLSMNTLQSNTERTGAAMVTDTGDILYTSEHVEMQNSLKKLIDKEINPYVEEWESARMFPAHTLFKKLGSAGFLGVNKSSEYGGLSLDFSYSIAVAEALGHVSCGGIPMAIGVQADMATPALAAFGSDELKREFLAPAISGDAVCCIGVSEPQAGSDVAGAQTRAEKSGDDFVINGTKMWITNGMQADWMCLLANTSTDNAPYQNKSLMCVPLNSKGVKRSKIEKLGMHSSDTAIISFEDVRIPAKNIIGEIGMGFVYQMLQFQLERMYGIAGVLVPMDELIQKTIQYTKDRKAFGKPLLDNQVVHYRLAELQTEVEALRSLLYRAVAVYLGGQDVTKLASMGKLKAGRLAREVADSCMQYWGGMGYAEESCIPRYFRDLRLLSIGAGADEVMLAIISKYMGTLPKGKGQ